MTVESRALFSSSLPSTDTLHSFALLTWTDGQHQGTIEPVLPAPIATSGVHEDRVDSCTFRKPGGPGRLRHTPGQPHTITANHCESDEREQQVYIELLCQLRRDSLETRPRIGDAALGPRKKRTALRVGGW